MSKLVVVADSPWVFSDVRAALATESWQYVEVSDPRQAVEVVTRTLPDAVIVDLQVGSMGGMAVTRAIRQAVDPRPRIIMLLDRYADRFLAKRAGADAAVVKPLEGPHLRWALADGAGDEEE